MQTAFTLLDVKSTEMEAFLSRSFSGTARLRVLLPLQGDASDRAYFRLSFDLPGDRPGSAVLMKLSSPCSEEELPFLNIRRYLARLNLPVPEVYGYWREKGIVLLEDLGDVTLEQETRGASRAALAEFYRRAVALLARLQLAAARNPDPECFAFQRRFDASQFTAELHHFQRYMIEGVKDKRIASEDREALLREFSTLSSCVAGQEQALCHRDYHSRNLMVKSGELSLLDFQDARLGPRSYDLASLLRDSYTVLPEDLVEEMTDTFCRSLEEGGAPALSRSSFRVQFDFMALQRNLKALGTFAYQFVVRNNDRYLQHVPPTLGYVARTLARYRNLQPLRRLLNRYLF